MAFHFARQRHQTVMETSASPGRCTSMPYAALATDYDGTIAHDGVVDAPTLDALARLRASGRKLVLVTGRELDDLIRVLPQLDLFDRVVAENGALLYRPDTREERPLAPPPPPRFAERLREFEVDPLSVGRVIVATWEPNEGRVLDAIRELGLDLQIIFNKGAVMVLPAGVNKESGLRAALEDLAISPLDCVAVGDAENDAAFLDVCGCPVAVANALPSLKERAALVTEGERGAGVAELIARLVATDLAEVDRHNPRQLITLADGDPALLFAPQRESVLLAGVSGGGKSTLTLGLMERLAEGGFQYCVIDPEGDYEGIDSAVGIGGAHDIPTAEKVSELLRKTGTSATVNLLGVKPADRPAFFAGLLPELLKLRTRIGRPHFIIVDEAHHVLPAAIDAAGLVPSNSRGLMFITTRIEALAAHTLACVDRVLAVGAEPHGVLAGFCAAAGLPAPPEQAALEVGEVLTVGRDAPEVRRLRAIPSAGAKRRHRRKYAEGALGEDKSFYFRGPGDRMNLRARNLVGFLDLADGVDEETWGWHRARGDYSRWIDLSIKDAELTAEVVAVEAGDAPPEDARAAIRDAIERRYTLPG